MNATFVWDFSAIDAAKENEMGIFGANSEIASGAIVVNEIGANQAIESGGNVAIESGANQVIWIGANLAIEIVALVVFLMGIANASENEEIVLASAKEFASVSA